MLRLFESTHYLLCKKHHKLFMSGLLYILLLVCGFIPVQGNVQVCDNVQPPIQGNDPVNCSLVCSLKFQHAVTSMNTDEVALCAKNTSIAVFCESHVHCRQYHAGAYCKMIPCLCKAKLGPRDSYIFDSSLKIPKLNTCVVSSKYLHLELPIVPFPWKTLLIVCAIVFVFAACLICLRWASPIIRSMQAKRATRSSRERQTTNPEDNASFFTPTAQQNDATPFTYYFPQGLPQICRANPRRSQRGHRSSSRARYSACSQGEGSSSSGVLENQDKPPPYEAAIQLPPPAYEDVQRAINESRINDNRQSRNQRVEVHTTTVCDPPNSSAS